MPEKVVIQKKRITTLGQYSLPLFLAVIHVPQESYANKVLTDRTDALMTLATIEEGMHVHHFPSYDHETFFVSSPQREQTKNIAKAILHGYDLEFVMK